MLEISVTKCNISKDVLYFWQVSFQYVERSYWLFYCKYNLGCVLISSQSWKIVKTCGTLCLASHSFLRISARTPSKSICSSPFSWQIFCSTGHAIIWSETFVISVSILFKRQRLRMPNALSATTRADLALRLKHFSTPVSAGPCGF